MTYCYTKSNKPLRQSSLMNKRKSLEKILENYEMDIHCAHFDSEDEMRNTLIRAKEYLRELEEKKEKGKKGVK